MDTPAPEAGGRQARFECAVCGELAGQVWLATPADAVSGSLGPALQAMAELDVLERPGDQAALVVEAFVGITSHPISADRIDVVTQAISHTDASLLYRLSYSYAPYHCPDCAANYCGSHWAWREFDDDPFGGIEGDCPRGHFHVLSY